MQVYINYGDNSRLDPMGFTVVANVTIGMAEVVDKVCEATCLSRTVERIHDASSNPHLWALHHGLAGLLGLWRAAVAGPDHEPGGCLLEGELPAAHVCREDAGPRWSIVCRPRSAAVLR